jgi:hypothetical protein
MSIKLEEFVKGLKSKIEVFISPADVKTSIDGNRVMIMIDKEEVKTRIIIPVAKVKRPSRLEPEEVIKLREFKRILKGKRDSIYLVTLLMSLHSELKKMNFSKLDNQSKDIIVPALNTVEQDFTKLLEVKK